MYKKGLGGTMQDYWKVKEFFGMACKDGDPQAAEINEELFGARAPKSRWNQ